MHANAPSIKEVRNSLKELAMISALPLKVKRCLGTGTGSRKGVELRLTSPSDLGSCVAVIYFNKGGNFVEALVCEPGRWAHCIAEQLTADQALDESARWVDTMEDVEKYLKRQPYEWDGKKEWLKRVRKA